jgi:PAS domain S-box-containing protein
LKEVQKMVQHTTTTENTEQTRVEQELRKSQAQLAAIFSSAMDAIITTDESQRILLFNAAAEVVFGYPAEKVIGGPLDQLLPYRYRKIHAAHIRDFGETGTTSRSMGLLGRLYALRSDGTEFPIEASISQIVTKTGRLFTVILRDVSERVDAEDIMLENAQELRASFEQAAVGMAHVSPDGHWLRVNQKLCDIVGYTREELYQLTFQDITYPDDLHNDLELQEQLLAGKISMYALEKRYIRKDGTSIWINLTVSLVRNKVGSPKYLIKLAEDITDRKTAESALRAKTDEIQTMTQQLWQTAKLATMGELAASVAHELNNPLAILSLRIESLLSGIPENAPEQSELKVMEQEVERMASLVSNLLQFSRSGQRQVSTLDIREEIERTLELIHNHLVHRRISVHREFSPSLAMIHADRQQLRQLFLNLFSNASDAMPDGGDLTIEAGSDEQKSRIRVVVRDTGIGISPEHLPKILDPFYTTKPEGKGTGLGLAICRRIVEEHKGTLRVFSPGPGGGAEFRISLPAVNEPGAILED